MEKKRGFAYRHAMNVAGHRGDSYNAYENTMEAFEAAKAEGADMIETDVRMTRDGHLILMHDASAYRTSGVSAQIADLTLEEVRALNVGDEDHVLRVPTLEECLDWLHGSDLWLNLEVKEYHQDGNEERSRICVEKSVELVHKYGMEDRMVLNSFDAWVLEYADERFGHRFLLHGFYPYSKMFHVQRNPDEYLYCACVSGTYKLKEYYDYLLERGIEPWAAPNVTSEDMLALSCKYGARMVTANDPLDAVRKLEHLGKR